MLPALFLTLLTISIIYLTRKAKELFAYMEIHHHTLWVRMGSPSRLPGMVAGTKEPAFIFLFEGGYRDISDRQLRAMCRSINRSSKAFAALHSIIFTVLITVAATNN
ncbi:hypothetical protein [Endozoicomonas elysicola]|uniref:Uncharacterized protein n=1 Tax=Endozoicomonas elysicola TaxID=305900 RepID=A0A081KDL2_9GAMM|nr:hypothetical protein [Endozoicomonas elysicola]KEI72238.1 hypothetical protein GV64_17215 [Endozoicomonas elysicola]